MPKNLPGHWWGAQPDPGIMMVEEQYKVVACLISQSSIDTFTMSLGGMVLRVTIMPIIRSMHLCN